MIGGDVKIVISPGRRGFSNRQKRPEEKGFRKLPSHADI